jgi:glucose/arabinose dehydrogenase
MRLRPEPRAHKSRPGPPTARTSNRPSPARPACPACATEANLAHTVVASGLDHPWGLALLPDGRWLVTETPGRLRIITAQGQIGEPIAGLPAVSARGQGGLLDVAVGPTFAQDRLIYWSLCRAA